MTRLLTMFTSIRDWLWLTRITVLVPIALAAACGLELCGLSILSQSASVVGIVVLLAAGGFVLNDAFDVDQDRINNPARPVARGAVRSSTAMSVGQVLVAGSLILSIATGNFQVLFQVVLGSALVMAYGRIGGRAGWLRNPVTAILSVMPWTLPAALSAQWSAISLPAMAGFCLVFGREVFLDVLDLEGDSRTGITTLPMIIGRPFSTALSIAITAATALGVLVLRGGEDTLFDLVWLVGVFLPTVVVASVAFARRQRPLPRVLSHVGKAQIITAVLAWWMLP